MPVAATVRSRAIAPTLPGVDTSGTCGRGLHLPVQLHTSLFCFFLTSTFPASMMELMCAFWSARPHRALCKELLCKVPRTDASKCGLPWLSVGMFSTSLRHSRAAPHARRMEEETFSKRSG